MDTWFKLTPPLVRPEPVPQAHTQIFSKIAGRVQQVVLPAPLDITVYLAQLIMLYSSSKQPAHPELATMAFI